MNRRKTPTAPEPEPSDLAVEVELLRNEVRVLRQAIDEVREELQYLNTNGVRLRDTDQFPPVGILKRMAADVTSSEWSQRLQIDFGNDARTARRPDETNHTDGSQSNETILPAAMSAQTSANALPESVAPESHSKKSGQLF